MRVSLSHSSRVSVSFFVPLSRCVSPQKSPRFYCSRRSVPRSRGGGVSVNEGLRHFRPIYKAQEKGPPRIESGRYSSTTWENIAGARYTFKSISSDSHTRLFEFSIFLFRALALRACSLAFCSRRSWTWHLQENQDVLSGCRNEALVYKRMS